MLGELIPKYTNNLSRTLQHISMLAAEGQEVGAMTVTTIKSIRSDEQFDHFWEVIT